MFSHVLQSHPAVVCVSEYLNPFRRGTRDEKVAAIRAFYSDGRAGNHVPSGGTFGQTMNPLKYELAADDIAEAFRPAGQASVLGRLGSRFRKLPLRVVLLVRTNSLKQAVSEMSAEKRGNWASDRSRAGGTEAIAIETFDIAELQKKVKALSHRSIRLRRLMQSLHAEELEITYEELQTNPKALYGRVFDFLGVPPPPADFEYSAGFTKLLSDDLREVIANFDEVRAVPEFAKYL